VNLYIPSVLSWREKGITIRQETRFPEEEGTTLIFNAAQPARLTVNLRVPYWATNGFGVKINGQAMDVKGEPESYLAIDREWKDGDRLEVSMPMSLHLHHASDVKNHVAIMYGPIVLAGEMGRENMPPTQEAHDQNQYNRVPRPSPPFLSTDDENASDWLKPVAGKPLTFETTGVGRPIEMTLIPLYAVMHERYTVYWKMGAN
jgi:hypothetical protein